MNESLRTIDGRHVLRTERRLAHAPEKVWRALTEAPHLRAWFPAAVDLELKVGGAIRFTIDGDVTTGVVTDLDPPRVFAFTWDNEHLRWEVVPEAGGCLLILSHTFDDRPAAASYAGGWNICIDALEAALAGREVVQPEDTFDVHERYVAVLGLAGGHVETTGDGWQIRVERQLFRPVERVWAALLAGAAEPVVAGGPPPPGVTVDVAPAAALTELAPPHVLEYSWQHDGRPAGRVRWQLSPGPGGARLVLTHTGPHALADRSAPALAAWQALVEGLVAALR